MYKIRNVLLPLYQYSFSNSNNYQNAEILTLAAALYDTRPRHLVGFILSVKTLDLLKSGINEHITAYENAIQSYQNPSQHTLVGHCRPISKMSLEWRLVDGGPF